ncbi:MAG: hypothetical protein WC091_23300 [Sulfuricellaceae bacterium]
MLKADYYNFEPSTETKVQYLYARTNPHPVGGVTYPGLFDIHNYGKDRALFFLVLVLEAISLGFLVWAGDGSWMVWVGALVFVALDLFITYLHHMAAAGKTKQWENELVVADLKARQADNTRMHDEGLEASRLERAISGRKKRALLASMVLWLLAFTKIFTYYGLSGEVNITTILICTFYLIVAFLHNRYTGYYWGGRILKGRLKTDQLIHMDGNGNYAQSYNERLENTPGMKEAALESGHRIRREQDSQEKEYFQLAAWGLLTDPQLSALVYKFDDVETQKEVARKGLMLQLKILGAPSSKNNNAPRLKDVAPAGAA